MDKELGIKLIIIFARQISAKQGKAQVVTEDKTDNMSTYLEKLSSRRKICCWFICAVVDTNTCINVWGEMYLHKEEVKEPTFCLRIRNSGDPKHHLRPHHPARKKHKRDGETFGLNTAALQSTRTRSRQQEQNLSGFHTVCFLADGHFWKQTAQYFLDLRLPSKHQYGERDSAENYNGVWRSEKIVSLDKIECKN